MATAKGLCSIASNCVVAATQRLAVGGSPPAEECGAGCVRENGLLAGIGAEALSHLNGIRSMTLCSAGDVLFLEGGDAAGIYILCKGRIKLSVSSQCGTRLAFGIAGPGDVPGLSAVLAGTPHEMTAEALRPSQVGFIRRCDFLKFVSEYPQVHAGIIKQMASAYQNACGHLRMMALAPAPRRLARVLLDISLGAERGDGRWSVQRLTHEELGEFVGCSRETVTRTLSKFKEHDLIGMCGIAVSIKDRGALERLAANSLAPESEPLLQGNYSAAGAAD